jgi:WD40 repeat protein
LVLWDPAARKTRVSVQASGPVGCLKFAPDGKRLAVGGERGIIFWDVETGKETAVVYEPRHRTDALDLSFSPDGKTMAWLNDHDVRMGRRGS